MLPKPSRCRLPKSSGGSGLKRRHLVTRQVTDMLGRSCGPGLNLCLECAEKQCTHHRGSVLYTAMVWDRLSLVIKESACLFSTAEPFREALRLSRLALKQNLAELSPTCPIGSCSCISKAFRRSPTACALQQETS